MDRRGFLSGIPFLGAKPLIFPAINLVFDGDSITYGKGATTGYASRVVQSYTRGEVVSTANQATNGAQMETLESRVPTAIPGRINVLIAWALTQDLYFGADPDALLLRLETYCNARKGEGWRVIVASVLPRDDGVSASFEARRKSLNDTLRAEWWEYAEGFADVAAGPMGTLSPELYYDRVHPTDAGHAFLARVFKAQIDRAS